MAVSPRPDPLQPEGCTRGEGRRKRRVPSGTRAIISLTAPLSFLSHVTVLSPPPNYHITRWFPSCRPIRRTAARRSIGTGGEDVGEQHRDIGRNLLRSLHRHLAQLVFFWQIEKIMLESPAEVPDEGSAKKRRGRPAKVGHFHEEAAPNHFLRIIFKPTFGRLMIPKALVKRFGEIPSNIIVTTNTGYNWRMTTRREGNDAFIDQGWTAFGVAHQLKVGQFLTFRKVSSFECSVVIFDHTCTEVEENTLSNTANRHKVVEMEKITYTISKREESILATVNVANTVHFYRNQATSCKFDMFSPSAIDEVEERKGEGAARIDEELGVPSRGNGCDRGTRDRVAGLQLIQLTGEEASDALVHLDFGVVSRRCEGDRNTEYEG
ncbi:hypothetical protein QYE76_043813 [Lolium multiflorum]|uniref:TF-B3 domain-containing protein n=1 Tax=Lolium multiflorum TaxID=4521 RepID=A0AAD8WW66_LOLMU|nr:hypothetical protein QYE76_043813 [Lolium multiflorum]